MATSFMYPLLEGTIQRPNTNLNLTGIGRRAGQPPTGRGARVLPQLLSEAGKSYPVQPHRWGAEPQDGRSTARAPAPVWRPPDTAAHGICLVT